MFFYIKYRTWDQRKRSLFTVEGCSPKTNRAISPMVKYMRKMGPGKSVHYKKVFTNQGCSLWEVSLYWQNSTDIVPGLLLLVLVISTGFPGVLDFLEFWRKKIQGMAWKLPEYSCFCYNVLESPWKHEKPWTFFKVIALNYLYFPKFCLLMMLRFLPVTHDIWELPRLTHFLINLNKYSTHIILSTTEANILIGRLICKSKD